MKKILAGGVAHTWADGFGVWHVRVSKTCCSPLIAARKAIKAELEERHNDVAREAWNDLVRVEDKDTETSVVYREGGLDQ